LLLRLFVSFTMTFEIAYFLPECKIIHAIYFVHLNATRMTSPPAPPTSYTTQTNPSETQYFRSRHSYSKFLGLTFLPGRLSTKIIFIPNPNRRITSADISANTDPEPFKEIQGFSNDVNPTKHVTGCSVPTKLDVFCCSPKLCY
jgi:hypothetical protein